MYQKCHHKFMYICFYKLEITLNKVKDCYFLCYFLTFNPVIKGQLLCKYEVILRAYRNNYESINLFLFSAFEKEMSCMHRTAQTHEQHNSMSVSDKEKTLTSSLYHKNIHIAPLNVFSSNDLSK